MKNKTLIEASFILFFSSLFLIGQTANIFFLSDFNWIAFADHDQIYQVEKFILDNQLYPIEMLNSFAADYGSEFFWVGLPYRLLQSLFNFSDLNWTFYYLSFIHLFTSCAALYFLAKTYFNDIPKIYRVLFFFVLSCSALFVSYSAFLKPDPSLVLLSITLCLYYLKRLEESDFKTIKFLFFAIFWAAFGAAIKWWSVFLIPFIMWKYYQKKIYLHETGFFKKTKSPFFLPLLLSIITYIVMRENGSNEIISFCGAMTTLFFFFILSKFFSRFFFPGILFTIFFALINFPVLISPQFKISMAYYSKYFLASPNAQEQKTSFLENSISWVHDSFQSGFLSFPLLALFFLGLWIFIKRKQKNYSFQIQVLLGYTLTIIIFLFFFISKKNWATQAMIYPLLCLSLILIISSQKSKILNIVLGITLFLEGSFSFIFPRPINVFEYYLSKKDLSKNIQIFQHEVESFVKKDDLIVCNRDIPVEDGVKRVSFPECEAIISQNIPFHSVLLTVAQVEKLETKNLALLKTFSISHPERTGEVTKREFFLYQRKSL